MRASAAFRPVISSRRAPCPSQRVGPAVKRVNSLHAAPGAAALPGESRAPRHPDKQRLVAVVGGATTAARRPSLMSRVSVNVDIATSRA